MQLQPVILLRWLQKLPTVPMQMTVSKNNLTTETARAIAAEATKEDAANKSTATALGQVMFYFLLRMQ